MMDTVYVEKIVTLFPPMVMVNNFWFMYVDYLCLSIWALVNQNLRIVLSWGNVDHHFVVSLF